jgi:hypothetical protein
MVEGMSYPLVTVRRVALDEVVELSGTALEILRRENSNDPLVSALTGALAEIRIDLLMPVG